VKKKKGVGKRGREDGDVIDKMDET